MTDDFTRGQELLAEGRHAIALEHFAAAADGEGTPSERAAAAAFAAEISLVVGRPHEALAWIGRLREDAGHEDQACLLEALARVRLGEGEAALALLDRVHQPDTVYSSYPLSSRCALRAQALALTGRRHEAMDALVAALGADPTDPYAWEQLADLCAHPEVDPRPALEVIPEDSFAATLGHLVTAPVAGVERIIEAMWSRRPGDPRVLALLPYLGHGMAVERALEWSDRMRAAGHGQDCPLLGIAASDARGGPERVRAAAVAGAVFGDSRARALIELAATAVPNDDLSATLDQIAAIAPDLVDAYLIGAAGSPTRSLLLAAALAVRGSGDAAVALARHAAAPPGDPLARSGLPPGDLLLLAEVASERGAPDLEASLRAAAQAARRRAEAIAATGPSHDAFHARGKRRNDGIHG